MHSIRHSSFSKLLSSLTILAFTVTAVIPPAQAQSLLPEVGTMLQTTNAYQPALIKGVTIDPERPLHMDFIVDLGDAKLDNAAIRTEAEKMIKYFLASLTVPEDDKWVNLSPYEQNRITSETLGQTEMGRDLLAQDYMLKQLTASMMYPENELGKKFWERVYAKTQALFGTTNIPMDTFNKVWIIPDHALVQEYNQSAFIAEKHLKVMLEEDYFAMEQSRHSESGVSPDEESQSRSFAGAQDDAQRMAQVKQIVREVIIPELEREVNEGETFANLRQIYNAMILATWYRQAMKESLLGQAYADRGKVRGVEQDDPAANEKIWEQYVESFRKGVYDLLREDYDPVADEAVVRRYFSGGTAYAKDAVNFAELDHMSKVTTEDGLKDDAVLVRVDLSGDDAVLDREITRESDLSSDAWYFFQVNPNDPNHLTDSDLIEASKVVRSNNASEFIPGNYGKDVYKVVSRPGVGVVIIQTEYVADDNSAMLTAQQITEALEQLKKDREWAFSYKIEKTDSVFQVTIGERRYTSILEGISQADEGNPFYQALSDVATVQEHNGNVFTLTDRAQLGILDETEVAQIDLSSYYQSPLENYIFNKNSKQLVKEGSEEAALFDNNPKDLRWQRMNAVEAANWIKNNTASQAMLTAQSKTFEGNPSSGGYYFTAAYQPVQKMVLVTLQTYIADRFNQPQKRAKTVSSEQEANEFLARIHEQDAGKVLENVWESGELEDVEAADHAQVVEGVALTERNIVQALDDLKEQIQWSFSYTLESEGDDFRVAIDLNRYNQILEDQKLFRESDPFYQALSEVAAVEYGENPNVFILSNKVPLVEKKVDAAMNAKLPEKVGGIDLSEKLLNLRVNRDEKGMLVPVDPAMVDAVRINVQGFRPIITNIINIQGGIVGYLTQVDRERGLPTDTSIAQLSLGPVNHEQNLEAM